MKSLKIIFLFVCTIVTMIGCFDNNTGPQTINEYAEKSNYYIVNQSELDLHATYVMTSRDRDSTVAVPATSTTKIFEDAAIGGTPAPSSSFANLRFYKKFDNRATPLLTIQPIINENWNRTVEADRVAKYELVVTDENIE